MVDNIKSQIILNKIFGQLRNKRKLNIIKYNKKLLFKLNISNQDFEIYNSLKEYNKKYHTKIEDINIKEIFLPGNYLKNEGLTDLITNIKFKFQELIKFCVSSNVISEITILEKANFKKLKILDLGYNSISDISILEKIDCKGLQELYLGYNDIANINVLEKVKFPELKILNLSDNRIKDINILGKVNFKKLERLNLGYNGISDISVFEKVNFEELKELNLYFTKIDKEIYFSIINDLKSKIKNFSIS